MDITDETPLPAEQEELNAGDHSNIAHLLILFIITIIAASIYSYQVHAQSQFINTAHTFEGTALH